MKRTVPLLITALAGFILLAAYFVPALGAAGEFATVHFNILAAVAFVLGGGNLLRVHLEKVLRGQARWGYSLVTVVAFLTTLAVGLFKIGVTPDPGYVARLLPTGGSRAEAFALVTQRGDNFSFRVDFYGGEKDREYDVKVTDELIGKIQCDADGKGKLMVRYRRPLPGDPPATQPVAGAALARWTGAETVNVGGLVSGQLAAVSRVTGTFRDDGSAMFFIYEYVFKPLQSTMFALLAFYVASAAFRAFRARNVESTLLLGTAFIILLGRTSLGAGLTEFVSGVPYLSLLYVPNLEAWIMGVPNTAGNRAILIGVALGIASTSLKVLLGIDRSYLGSDKG